jgi:hypothetical protein
MQQWEMSPLLEHFLETVATKVIAGWDTLLVHSNDLITLKQ